MSLDALDVSFFFLINRGLQNSVFDSLMPFMSNRGLLLCLPFLVWAAAREKKKILPYLLLSVAAIGAADGGGNVLKHIFERTRPCNALEGVNLLVGCGRSFSMPSNHALNSFAFACIFWPLRRYALNAALLCIASLVAFSRVYVGVHYPGDVLAGMMLGAATAGFVLFLYRWAVRIYHERSYTGALWMVLLVLSLFRVYHVITGPFELLPDEAHYWEWSRRPDWGYYSKGPLIASIIYAGTHLFGNTEFGVRFFAIIFSAVSSLLLFRLGRDMYDERTGLVAAILVQIVPLYSVFGVFMTIDSPFILFWILSLLLFWRAFTAEQDPAGGKGPLRYWVLLGLSIGFGMLAKHLIALFYVSGLLFMAADRDARGLLRRPGPYLSVVIGLLIFSPVILWNASHAWVTFRHTAGQAHLHDGLRISLKDFAEYLGSQIGLVTPVLFFMILIALFRLRRDRKGSFLFWFAAPTLLFFGLKSIQGKVQGNWALAAYATGFIAFAVHYMQNWASATNRQRHFIRAALIGAGLVTVLAHFPQHIPIPAAKHPLKKISGWKELGREMSGIHKEMAAEGPVVVMTDAYQASSLLAFYMEGNPVTYCLRLNRRMNQYDLWPGLENAVGQNVLFTGRKDKESMEAVSAYFAKAFDRCEKQEVTVTDRLRSRVKYNVFKCYHFNGFQPDTEELY